HTAHCVSSCGRERLPVTIQRAAAQKNKPVELMNRHMTRVHRRSQKVYNLRPHLLFTFEKRKTSRGLTVAALCGGEAPRRFPLIIPVNPHAVWRNARQNETTLSHA